MHLSKRGVVAFISVRFARVLISVVALGLWAASRAHGQQSLLQGTLTPGPYAVGFRTLFTRDTSRRWLDSGHGSAASDSGRPIRISLWYPVDTGDRTPVMHYGDYLHYEGPRGFQRLDDTLERADRQSWIADLTDVSPTGRELAARLFSSPVAARRDAPPAPGRFPLVLYTGGLGSRGDANAELGEYLASHGYVIATGPQLGPSETDLDLGGSPPEVLLHVQDLAFALRVLRALPNVDSGPIGIAGHSMGGVVALQFAMRNGDVTAVVGLDGSYGMHGEGSHPRPPEQFFPDFAPESVRAALLDLRRANGVQGATLDSTVVSDLYRADRYIVTFRKMYHGDFTEYAPIGLHLSVPLPPNGDGRTRQTGYDGNQAAYHAVLDFFDATLRHLPRRIPQITIDLQRVAGLTIKHESAR